MGAPHKHTVARSATKPGTGNYTETCSCGAKRVTRYRGQDERNCEVTHTKWKLPLARRVKKLAGKLFK